MAMRMLIDARHREETRVAVLDGNKIEEFDFESAEHKQIKGNIYLAKVTRVEPSLQAAFVDFGGNRHGFLAFSEIHPDYYQIPAADREALLAEEQAHAEEEAALRAEEDDEEDSAADELADEEGDGVEEIDTFEKDDVATIEDGLLEDDGDRGDDGDREDDRDEDSEQDSDADGERDEDENGAEAADDESGSERSRGNAGRGGRGRARRQGQGGDRAGDRGGDRGSERGGGRARAKEMDELRAKRQALRRRYKIQDVIQRRQVLLVQVVKEERGNKGAALTSYLSLAGRYCVLMPNSSNGGGISRKISSGPDRKRLKQIVGELSLPKSMGLIVRTAGLQRTKTEIKRDFDYLARLWDEIRENTLASSAPAVIHSDSDLIKRAIRDIYNREIDDVVVEGEEGFNAARQFMKLLMPSHAKRVKSYSDPVPLFQRYGAEDQLSAMYDPVVQLKSGGYLVINPTEALVSIDINSGRSTKEHGIEQTALSTNLEAAREIARQLRLRDMAGLVVIDFIDMENNSSIRKVEKAMKDALKNDRARIQIGRISGFGLMEMSRQRLRTGVLEATTRVCPHCDGTGLVRTASSAGLSALRLIEEEAAKGKGTLITLYASTEATIYLLNAKRADLAEIEHRYGVSVEVVPEGEEEGAKMRIQSSGPRPAEAPKFAPIIIDDDYADSLDEEEDEDEAEDEDQAEEQEQEEDKEDRGEAAPSEERAHSNDTDDTDEGGSRKKRRRRRRGGRGRNRTREQELADEQADEQADDQSGDEAQASDDVGESEEGEPSESEEGEPSSALEAAEADEADPAIEEEEAPRGRRRPRRRRTATEAVPAEETGSDEQASGDQASNEQASGEQASDEPVEPAPAAEEPQEEAEPAPERPARGRRRKPKAEQPVEGEVAQGEAGEEGDAKPKRRSRRRKADDAASTDAAQGDAAHGDGSASPSQAEESGSEASAPAKPKRAPRRRKSEESEPVAAAPEPAPAAPEPAAPEQVAPVAPDPGVATNQAESQADTQAEDGEDGESSPRRGWWQRTFGA